MKKTITILIASLVIAITANQAYASPYYVGGDYQDSVVISDNVLAYKFHHVIESRHIDQNLVAISLDKISSFINIKHGGHVMFTSNEIEYDDSVSIKSSDQYFTHVNNKVGIITQEEYEEYQESLLPAQPAGKPLDSNGAPSMSGFNTRDADRVMFTNVVKQPIFIMSNTEIHIQQGMATDRYVEVYFDGILIDTIDLRKSPSGDPHDKWVGFGGKIIDIPFWAYYSINEEAKLIYHGEGNQHHVSRDLNYIE